MGGGVVVGGGGSHTHYHITPVQDLELELKTGTGLLQYFKNQKHVKSALDIAKNHTKVTGQNVPFHDFRKSKNCPMQVLAKPQLG